MSRSQIGTSFTQHSSVCGMETRRCCTVVLANERVRFMYEFCLRHCYQNLHDTVLSCLLQNCDYLTEATTYGRPFMRPRAVIAPHFGKAPQLHEETAARGDMKGN